MRADQTPAHPDDIFPGATYYNDKGDLRTVEPRYTKMDYIRLGYKGANFMREESEHEFENRINALKAMCGQGLIFKKK